MKLWQRWQAKVEKEWHENAALVIVVAIYDVLFGVLGGALIANALFLHRLTGTWHTIACVVFGVVAFVVLCLLELFIFDESA